MPSGWCDLKCCSVNDIHKRVHLMLIGYRIMNNSLHVYAQVCIGHAHIGFKPELWIFNYTTTADTDNNNNSVFLCE